MTIAKVRHVNELLSVVLSESVAGGIQDWMAESERLLGLQRDGEMKFFRFQS